MERVHQEVSPVGPGDVVGGKYRVERVLGAGGMGVVVAAIQTELDRPVALKFLLPKLLERPGLVIRFSREARAAAKLESEHVARVLDVGTLEGGAPYIVMEYLEGHDLASVLAARGALPSEQAVGYVLQACEAIAEAHSRGIVHRDLKPGNLFLTNRASGAPVIKVLDFGLSKIVSSGEEHVTSESGILGSPLYMSPEQLMSPRTADARSDLWSMGVVLYELVTARAPFEYERIAGLVAAILQKPPVPMAHWRADVPAELQTVVFRCLEKDPSQRFPTVFHLAKALAPFGPPDSSRSVDRITHLLRSSSPKAAPSDAAEAPPTETPTAPNEAESVAGSSRSNPAALRRCDASCGTLRYVALAARPRAGGARGRGPRGVHCCGHRVPGVLATGQGRRAGTCRAQRGDPRGARRGDAAAPDADAEHGRLDRSSRSRRGIGGRDPAAGLPGGVHAEAYATRSGGFRSSAVPASVGRIGAAGRDSRDDGNSAGQSAATLATDVKRGRRRAPNTNAVCERLLARCESPQLPQRPLTRAAGLGDVGRVAEHRRGPVECEHVVVVQSVLLPVEGYAAPVRRWILLSLGSRASSHDERGDVGKDVVDPIRIGAESELVEFAKTICRIVDVAPDVHGRDVLGEIDVRWALDEPHRHAGGNREQGERRNEEVRVHAPRLRLSPSTVPRLLLCLGYSPPLTPRSPWIAGRTSPRWRPATRAHLGDSQRS